MSEKENKTLTEKLLGFLKSLASFVSAIVLCVLWVQGYVKETVQDSVKLAFAEVMQPIQKDIDRHETQITLLNYRADNFAGDIKDIKNSLKHLEAILPKENLEIEEEK